MLVKVYDMLLEIEATRMKKILKAFNKCASEVCEGQQWDMVFETQQNVSEAQYLNMINLKTAVLLGFSLELGARLAGASENDCQSLRAFGINIGMGFQLKDDLLDAYADATKFGKQVGGDIIANKKTFLFIKSLALANRKQRQELQRWISMKTFNKKAKVKAVKEIYDDLLIPASVEKKIDGYFKNGFSKLHGLNCNVTAKARLINFTTLLIQRES
jgi:geranylgeranyl diphosphate synthase type II